MSYVIHVESDNPLIDMAVENARQLLQEEGATVTVQYDDIDHASWAVWSDDGTIEMFRNEQEGRAAYRQTLLDNPVVADFIHLSRLTIDTEDNQ